MSDPLFSAGPQVEMNIGDWTEEEEQKLAELAKEYQGERLMPWSLIAAKIGTRTPLQCRRKW